MHSHQLIVIVLCGLLSPSIAAAQSQSALDIFSGVMTLVETKAAERSWEKLDRATYDCMDEMLAEQGYSIRSLVRSGVGPSDVRLRDLRDACSRTGQREDDGAPTSQILDEIEQALSNAAPKEVPRRDEEELLALRQEASALASSSDSAAAGAIVRQIDETLAGRPSASTDSIRIRLAQISDAADRQRAWEQLSGQAVALSSDVDVGTLPPEFIRRRSELKKRLDAALNPPPVPQREYSLPPADCSDKTNPIGMLICRSDDARWIVLEHSRAYYLMRHLRPSEREKLSAASILFQRQLVDKCGVRAALNDTSKQTKAILCVSSGFAAATAELSTEIRRIATVEAAEELARPIDDHLQLQGELLEQGYLPPDGEVDGIYGPQTRTALEQLAYAAGFPARGMMSDRAAEALLAGPSKRQVPDATAIAELEKIIADYRQYETDLEEARQIAEAEKKQKAHWTERAAVARELLGGYLSEDLRSLLLKYVEAAARTPPTPAEMIRLDAQFDGKSAELTRAEQINLVLTAKSQILVENTGGYAILYNDGPTAPSVSKGLTGDLVFTGDRVLACSVLSAPPDSFVSGHLRQAFATLGVTIRMPLEACDTSALERYDLVLFANDDAVFDAMLALMTAMRDGVMAQALVVTPREITAARTARASRLSEIDGYVRKSLTGYGYLALENESSNVCAIVPAGIDTHQALISADAELVQDELGRPATYLPQTSDEAFVAAKRHKCGAVYAGAADLLTLSNAFGRDGVEHSFWPIWHDAVEVAAAAEDAVARKRREAEGQADKTREATDDQALAQARESDAKVVRSKQQAALRQQYGAAANAFEIHLAEELSLFLKDDPAGQRFAFKYASLTAAYRGLVADGWELVDQSTTLSDYGTAEFKGRRLELGIAQSTIQLRNRILGEYKELCFITAFVNDDEFAMEREAFGMICEDSTEALETYKLGQRFESRWIVD